MGRQPCLVYPPFPISNSLKTSIDRSVRISTTNRNLVMTRSGGKMERRRRIAASRTPYDRPPTNWLSSARKIAEGAGRVMRSVLLSDYSSSSDSEGNSSDEEGNFDSSLPELSSLDGNGKNEKLNEDGRGLYPRLMEWSDAKRAIVMLLMQETLSKEECEYLTDIIKSRTVDTSTLGDIQEKRPIQATTPDAHSTDVCCKAVMEARKWINERKLSSDSKSVSPSSVTSCNYSCGSPSYNTTKLGSPVEIARSYMGGHAPSFMKSIAAFKTPQSRRIQSLWEKSPSPIRGEPLSCSEDPVAAGAHDDAEGSQSKVKEPPQEADVLKGGATHVVHSRRSLITALESQEEPILSRQKLQNSVVGGHERISSRPSNNNEVTQKRHRIKGNSRCTFKAQAASFSLTISRASQSLASSTQLRSTTFAVAISGAISLQEIKNESVDLEKIPIEEVFQQLKCTKEGLTSEEGANRLQIFGPNKLEEKKESKILKFLGFMWNPLSRVMEAAALMAICLANGGGRQPDWQDFVGIIVLLLINSTISFIEENNAGNAAAALMASLAPKTKVLRDGRWSEQDASILVPGDIISIKLGDIVPADARLLEGDPLKIDQSALTGESLPVTKNPSEEVFSGSTCKQGEIEAIVIATGVLTFFGKAAHLVDSTNQVGHFQKVLTAIGNFCICSIAIGMAIEIIIMYPIQRRQYRDGIDNLLVLLIGGIPIAMPTVLSVTMAIGSHRLSQQGAITKRMTAIEKMAGMDVLCSDKTGTLTLNKLSVDKTLIEVFEHGVEKEHVLLLAAWASRTENQDAIDAAIVNMLADPKEAREGVAREVHFLPINPVDKRTALTYVDNDGNWHRASKGAPEQIIDPCNCKGNVRAKAHAVIDGYADRGLRSLAVARQVVPEKDKDSPGGPWQFVGLLPLFDPPRHDSADTIRRALNLGVNVKMITGDQLAIAKETGKRLGMGTNMYPSSSLLGGKDNEGAIASLPIDDLIEMADGFAGVFPEHKYEIVKRLQEKKHICGMTGDGVNDAPALKKADIGIAVADATDAARSASDIVLTEPGLSVIISAVLTSRAIFQRMKNYTIYAVSITIRIVFGFMFIALIWKYDFSPFMVLIIAIINDGTIMTISKDRVKPSPMPDSWKLKEIFATGVVLGGYMALMTVIFFWAAWETNFFPNMFHVHSLRGNKLEMMAALYLQVSIISQALIFVTRSRSWSFAERPGLLLVAAFLVAQLVATFIAVHANWRFAHIKGMGWGWAGVIWLYSFITYLPLDILKFGIRYALSGKAWGNLLDNKTAFTTKKDYGIEEREAQWAAAQRTLHGLQPPQTSTLSEEQSGYRELSEIAEQAKRRADIARLRDQRTLKGRVESVVKLKGLDIDTSQHHYTV